MKPLRWFSVRRIWILWNRIRPRSEELYGTLRSKGVHYEILIETELRTYMVHTTDYAEVGREVGLKFGPEDIHVMCRMGRILMKQFKHLIKPYIIWASILIVVPLILIVLYAFTSDGNEVLTLHFTWANFAKFLETTYLSVILKSFRLGILTTLICLVCGYPLAYIISKYSEKVQSFLILMVTIPMWINMLLRTYAWMNILSDNGLVNNLLKMLGISPITMMYTDFFGYCGPCL